MRRGAVAQGRPQEHIHEETDRDADSGAEQPFGQQARLVLVARRQDDQRGGRGRRRLRPQPADGPGGQAYEHRDTDGQRADAEDRPGHEGEQHAEDGGSHLLHAVLERPEHGRMDRQQRSPRREEALREMEHPVRQHPGDHDRSHSLDELQPASPGQGVAQLMGGREAHEIDAAAAGWRADRLYVSWRCLPSPCHAGCGRVPRVTHRMLLSPEGSSAYRAPRSQRPVRVRSVASQCDSATPSGPTTCRASVVVPSGSAHGARSSRARSSQRGDVSHCRKTTSRPTHEMYAAPP